MGERRHGQRGVIVQVQPQFKMMIVDVRTLLYKFSFLKIINARLNENINSFYFSLRSIQLKHNLDTRNIEPIQLSRHIHLRSRLAFSVLEQSSAFKD
jgi:hypothetical protein